MIYTPSNLLSSGPPPRVLVVTPLPMLHVFTLSFSQPFAIEHVRHCLQVFVETMAAQQALMVAAGLQTLDEVQQLRVALERARMTAEDARSALVRDRRWMWRLIAVRCVVCGHLYVVDHAIRPQPPCPACLDRARDMEVRDAEMNAFEQERE